MFAHSRWFLLAAILTLLFAAACGSSGSSLENGSGNGLVAGNSPVSDGGGILPRLPLESGNGSRSTSAGEGNGVVLGKDFLLQHNGLVDGNALRLASMEGEGGIAYGMYRFEGLSGKKPLGLSCDTAPDPDSKFFVAVANYTDMTWEWFGPFAIPEANIALGESSDRYITELGNLYFLVLTEGGSACTHFEASLNWRDADPIGDDDMPGAPFELTASDGEFNDGVSVTWLGGEGASVFEVWRRLHEAEGEAEAWSMVAEVEANEYFDTDVDAGVKYRYKVRSRNEHGSSAYSNTDSGFAGEGGGGGDDWCPSELAASDGTSTEYVELNWNAGIGEVHQFKIWRRADGGGDFQLIAELDDNFYHDTTAEPDVWYIYRVQRVGEGESCFTNNDEGYRAGSVDEWCPSELWASDGTYGDGVKLEWNPGTGDGTFKVFRRSNPIADFQLIGDTLDANYFDTAVDIGVEYEYKVFKFAGEESCPTNSDTGWRGEGGDGWCPSDLAASDGTSSGGVWLEWNKGSGNGNFSVWRRVAESENEYALVEDGITGNEFLDASAEAGVVYSYFVRKHLEGETCDTNFDTGYRQVTVDDWCPSELWASDGSYSDKIRLEWNPGVGDGSFNVWRKRDGEGFQWILLGNTAGSDWNDTIELDGGVTYIYKVVKLGVDGECASNTDSGFLGDGNPMG
ncbi:hypothetical protein IT575_14400 [bacterium]|nr:hypothetical protein [bacterium]